jgi:uncharacterized protein DUF2490
MPLLTGLALILVLAGQTTTSDVPVDAGLWAAYKGNHGIGDSPWRLVLEGVAKRNRGILDAQAYKVQAGWGYEWKPDWEASTGFAFQYHIPFDSASQPYKWPEYRIYEEFKFPIKTGAKTIKQTISLRERWLARKSAPTYDEITSYKFEITPVYQFELVIPKTATTDLIFYDEVHLRMVPRDEPRFDQNRLFAGLGLKTENRAINRIEMGYMLQTVRNSSDTNPGRERVNHVIRLTLISKAPIR